MNLPKNIRIHFDKSLYQTLVYDASTGEPINNIKRIDLVADANNHVYEAKLVVDVHEITGDVSSPFVITKVLSDAELDDVAKRLEQRIIERLRIHQIDWLKDV